MLQTLLRIGIPTALFFGGLAYFFPWEWVGLMAVLLALLIAQTALFVKHLHPIRPMGGNRPNPLVGRTVGELTGNTRDGASKPAFSPEVYSRFRAHLEGAETQPATLRGTTLVDPSAKTPPPKASPKANEDEGVSVSLSGQAKKPMPRPNPYGSPGAAKKPAPGKAPPPPPAEMVEEAGSALPQGDLFEDLRPKLEDAAPEKPASAPVTPDRPPPAAKGEELSVLRSAKEALARGEPQKAREALAQHRAMLERHPELSHWKAWQEAAKLSVELGDHAEAGKAFHAMLSAGYPLQQAEVGALMDTLLGQAKSVPAARLKVTLLQTVLAMFRQSGDRNAMDAVYTLMEEAQEGADDDKKLIQFYKNHLEIRKALGKKDGQLELMDKIGNRFFKMGDTEGAREYYELALRLQQESK